MNSRAVLVGWPRWTLVRPRRGEPAAEEGQATVEFLGVLPAVLLILVMIWQLGLWASPRR
jgi:hypothetical protein